LLHFPAAVSAVSEQQLRQLTQMNQPGVAVLVALLEQLGANPAATMALTLERWRDRPEYRRLCELGAGEPLVPDQAAARQELSQAVARLLDSELRRRLEVLIEKARAQTLDDAEKTGTSGAHGCPNAGGRPLTVRRPRPRCRPSSSPGPYCRYHGFGLEYWHLRSNSGYHIQLFHERSRRPQPFVAPATERAVMSNTRLLETPLETP
jgi:hypothetical protein